MKEGLAGVELDLVLGGGRRGGGIKLVFGTNRNVFYLKSKFGLIT